MLAPPPSLPSLFDLPVFNTHGWALRAPTRSTRGTAASWLELAQSDELKQWEVKRGGFWQHDTHPSLQCSFLDEKRVRLLHGSERIARQLLHELGVDSTRTALQLAAAKLLRTNPGEGRQEVHYDITEYKRAARCFTVLLYLTPTLSTQLPRLSLAETRCCFTEGEKLPPRLRARRPHARQVRRQACGRGQHVGTALHHGALGRRQSRRFAALCPLHALLSLHLAQAGHRGAALPPWSRSLIVFIFSYCIVFF
jgi:hypothetical protein